MGVACVDVRVSRRLREELAWTADKWLWVIINIVLLIIVIPIRN